MARNWRCKKPVRILSSDRLEVAGHITAYFPMSPEPKPCLLDDHHFMLGSDFKLFGTEYGVGGVTYGSQIEARTLEHAEQLAIQRGLNERIMGELEHGDPKLNLLKHIDEENWAAALHEAVFLSFVGLTCGALSAREVLGDQGLVHEIAHKLHAPQFGPDMEIVNTLGETVEIVELPPEIAALDLEEDREATARIRSLAMDFARRVPGWPAALQDERLRASVKLECPCENCSPPVDSGVDSLP